MLSENENRYVKVPLQTAWKPIHLPPPPPSTSSVLVYKNMRWVILFNTLFRNGNMYDLRSVKPTHVAYALLNLSYIMLSENENRYVKVPLQTAWKPIHLPPPTPRCRPPENPFISPPPPPPPPPPPHRSLFEIYMVKRIPVPFRSESISWRDGMSRVETIGFTGYIHTTHYNNTIAMRNSHDNRTTIARYD